MNLLSQFGLRNEKLQEISDRFPDLAEKLEIMISMPDRFNDNLAPLGWIAYGALKPDVMRQATDFAEAGDLASAEHLLIDSYDPQHIEQRLTMMRFIEEFRPREKLLRKALEDYIAERYYACVPVILANIEGLVNDIALKGFFAEGTDLTAWDSIAAHSTGLQTLAKTLGRSRTVTTSEVITIPYRHGILHGRDLGYDNKACAAKSWAALFALRDWVVALRKPKPEPEHERSWIEILESIRDNQEETAKIEAWKPRNLSTPADFPTSGPSSAYGELTPERALAEFLELWMVGNYGKMAQRLCAMNRKDTVGMTAGWLRELFGEVQLRGFEMASIEDVAPAVSVIGTRISYTRFDQDLSKQFSVRMLFEDASGHCWVRGNPKGEWRVLLIPFFSGF